MTQGASHYSKIKPKCYADYVREGMEKGQISKDEYIIDGKKVTKNLSGLSDRVVMPAHLKLDLRFKYSKKS